MYEGTFQNGKRHGNGTLYDRSGNVTYSGEFYEGERFREVQSENMTPGLSQPMMFTGRILGEKRYVDGVLSYTTPDGQYQVRKHFQNGRLRLIEVRWSNFLYETRAGGWRGETLDTEARTGRGTLYKIVESDGSRRKVYEGMWNKNERSGQGTSYYDNEGEEYVGTWKNDMPHEDVKWYAPDGRLKYEGSFRRNSGGAIRNGKTYHRFKGKVYYVPGTHEDENRGVRKTFQGEFRDDDNNTPWKGVVVYDGTPETTYRGYFTNGRPNGQPLR